MKRLLLPVFLCLALAGYSQPKQMVITIDDLPWQLAGHDSAKLISMNKMLIGHLTRLQVPAIGFVNEQKLRTEGRAIPYRHEMLAEWTTNGLDLGNHTFSHQDYNQLSPTEFFEIVERGEPVTKKLMAAAGREYKYFRHPYLHRGNTAAKVSALEEYLDAHGYVEAPVTIDNSEWIFANAFDKALKANDETMMGKVGQHYISYMVAKVNYYETQSEKLFGRAIAHTLLIHANSLNAYYLDQLLQSFQSIGYAFISLQVALNDPAYTTRDTFVGKAGISWLDRWAISQGKKGDFFQGEPRCPQFVLDYTGLSE